MNSKAAEGGAQGDETVSADEITDTGVGQIEFRLSVFNKPAVDGPLTKTGKLGANGKPEMDGQNCWMSSGSVRVVNFKTMADGGALIGSLSSQQAIGLGIPKNGTAAQGAVKIVAKKLLNGAANVIARTKDHFGFEAGAGFMLLDFDAKWLSAEVLAKVPDLDALWKEITATVPGLADAGRIVRSSVSSGLSANGTKFPSSGGLHIYVAVKDATDIPRALRALHQRLMLAGLGGLVLGVVGQFLERSVIDVAVGSPERLVFEGEPMLMPPLVQDSAVRKPVTHEGKIVDTQKAIPSLTRHERIQLEGVLEGQKQKLMPEARRRRDAADRKIAEHLSKTTGIPIGEALRQVGLRHIGLLPPELELDFDDPVLRPATVEDLLASPDKYVDETLADPLEGIGYGRGKAKVMRGQDGGLIVHSFAHGGAVYRLVHNEITLAALIKAAATTSVVSMLAENLDPDAIPPDAQERLVSAAATKGGVGVKIVRKMLDEVVAKRRLEAKKKKQAAEDAFDERSRMAVPALDAPLYQVATRIDGLLAKAVPSSPDRLPMRGIDGKLATIRTQRLPEEYFHELDDLDVDDDDDGDAARAVKPAPATQMLVAVEKHFDIAAMVEEHVRIVRTDKDGNQREVALPAPHREPLNSLDGSKLPVVVGVATVPMVAVHPRLGICELFEAKGLHRRTGIFFDIPAEIRAAMPRVEDCDGKAAAKAARYLCGEWLVDVMTDEAGKAVMIAETLTVLQRYRFREKPAFMFVAAQAGSGKTMGVNMTAVAATGERAAATAWSKDGEERRKALFTFFRAGTSVLCFDNIPRGVELFCQHVEKALTNSRMADRILGTQDRMEVRTAGVVVWTGNAVSVRADLATRVLTVNITAKSANPANRAVKHGDPIAWTLRQRPKLLGALYTILMVPRPKMRMGDKKTRFKRWWYEIGLAVERAFEGRVDFASMFDAAIERDTEGAALAGFLGELEAEFRGGEFTSRDVEWMLDRHPRTKRDGVTAMPNAGWDDGGSDGVGEGTRHAERADRMRGWLAAVLGKGPLSGAITSNDVGYHLRTLVDRVVVMEGGGEARLTNRYVQGKGRWRVQWMKLSRRGEIEDILMRGGSEEQKRLFDAISACGFDILNYVLWTDEEVNIVWSALRK